MLGIALADNASDTAAGNHLTVLANRLHAAANFHEGLRKYGKTHYSAPISGQPLNLLTVGP